MSNLQVTVLPTVSCSWDAGMWDFSANVSDVKDVGLVVAVVSGLWRLQGWLLDSEVAWMLREWGMGN